MIYLPNNCTCSILSVNPKNWKTGGEKLLNKNWYIQYYFRDPLQYNNFPKGKLVIIKGMNAAKTLQERREITAALIDNELHYLKDRGFNPITKEFKPPKDNNPVNESTSLRKSFLHSITLMKLSTIVTRDINNVIGHFLDVCDLNAISNVPIHEIRKKDLYRALNDLTTKKGYSNKRYNRVRAYLMMIYKKLVDLDVVERNYVTDLPKRSEVKKMREILTLKEFSKIRNHLKENDYEFYRYIMIFFYSGSRSSELLRLKVSAVDLENSTFIVNVLKGRSRGEGVRVINNDVLDLWREIIEGSALDNFVFGWKFKSGSRSIGSELTTRKWKFHVKKTLGINKDLYSLKHLHTSLVSEFFNDQLAAKINGHTSIKTNDRFYNVTKNKRLLNQAKSISIKID